MRSTSLALFLAASIVALASESAPELAAPTGVDASDGVYTLKVGVGWEHVRGAETYRVLRSEDDDPASATVIGTTKSIIFYDEKAVAGRAYRYWVQAENALGVGPLSRPDAGFVAEGKTGEFGPIWPMSPPPEPAENPVTGAKVYLGKTLFWDEQLSATRTVACGTCHIFSAAGADPRADAGSVRSRHPGFDGVFNTDDDAAGSPGVPLNRPDGSYEWSPAFGIREQATRRKAQSVIDAAYADEGLFWDGRASQRFVDPVSGEVLIPKWGALESQVLGPPLDTTEMGHVGREWSDVVERLRASAPLALAPTLPAALDRWIGARNYPELFAEAFGSREITPARIAMAIASYERTLYSDRAEIDAYVAEIADEPEEVARGRQLFLSHATFCTQCHRGGLMSDNRFRYIGVRPHGEDDGRWEVTRRADDRGKFRAPSLRNVALRAPYMHNGRLETLTDVVRFYNDGGDFTAKNKDTNFVTRLKLDERERSDLEAFLRALTDPRVAAEAGPIFDRPTLYSESSRRPRVIGEGHAPGDEKMPQVVALEPPLLGLGDFTVGLYDAPAGAEALLVIDRENPDPRRAPAEAALFSGRAVVAPEGYASLTAPLPNDSALVGETFYGRWYVLDDGEGVRSATAAFRFAIFAPRRAPKGSD